MANKAKRICDYLWRCNWVDDYEEIAPYLNGCEPGWALHEVKIDKDSKGGDGYLIILKMPNGSCHETA